MAVLARSFLENRSFLQASKVVPRVRLLRTTYGSGSPLRVSIQTASAGVSKFNDGTMPW
jgi:hypothetical protein